MDRVVLGSRYTFLRGGVGCSPIRDGCPTIVPSYREKYPSLTMSFPQD